MSELAAEETVLDLRPTSVRLTAGGAVVAVVLNLMWGTNPVALKLALRDLPPMGSTGVRFAIAAVGVSLWCALTRTRLRPPPGEARWLALIIGIFLAQIATFTLGVHYGNASHSVVVLYLYPFLVVALAHFFLPDEKVTRARLAGLITAFSGIVFLFASQLGHWHGTLLLGDLCQLVSAFLLAGQIVLVKHAVARVDPTRLVFWQMLTTAACFLAIGLGFEHLYGTPAGPLSWAAILYQGVFIGAVGFTVWTWQMRRFSAATLAIFGFLGPPTGVLISGLLLHEPITPALLVSAGMVAAGIVVSSVWDGRGALLCSAEGEESKRRRGGGRGGRW